MQIRISTIPVDSFVENFAWRGEDFVIAEAYVVCLKNRHINYLIDIKRKIENQLLNFEYSKVAIRPVAKKSLGGKRL